jgi:glycosyltransferase involved in cell wall biosynthesis
LIDAQWSRRLSLNSLKSLIDFKYQNKYEIVLIDDCGQDDSLKIAKRYKQTYPNLITLLEHEYNQGLSAARNAAMNHANGRYLIFVDSDDWLSKGWLADILSILAENEPDLLFFDQNHVWLNKISSKHYDNSINELKLLTYHHIDEMVNTLPLLAGGLVVLTEKIKQFPLGLIFEDLATVPAIIAKCKRIMYLPKCYYQYRQRTDSIMGTAYDKPERVFPALEFLKNRDCLEQKFSFEFISFRKLLMYDSRRLFSLEDKQKAIIFVGQSTKWLDDNYPNWKSNPYVLLVNKPASRYFAFLPSLYLKLLRFKIGKIIFLYKISNQPLRIRRVLCLWLKKQN